MTQETGFNNGTLKNQNRGLVLRLVITGECTSRIEVAKKTGLSKMAATNIITRFLEDRILEEQETIHVTGKGRNPIQLSLCKDAPKMIGVYLGYRECSVILTDMHLKILAKTSFSLKGENQDRLIEMICRSIDRILKKASGERIWGIGVSAEGPLDVKRGLIRNPLNRFGEDTIPVVELLESRYGRKVLLENRSNCAALAEKFFGNGRGLSDFLYVGISEGIGTGVISGGTIRESALGITAELGHLSIETKGKPCRCGRRGCLEMYASSQAVRARYKRAAGCDLQFREICKAAEKSEPEAMRVLDEMTEKLSSGLVSAVNLYAPQKILLGLDACAIPPRYFALLEEKINAGKLGGPFIPVQKPAFGRNAGIRGCTSGILKYVFDGALL